MKTLIATACLIAFSWAEPPSPSHSYLPPPPRNGGGYSSGYPAASGVVPPTTTGLPEVIAARSGGQRAGGFHGGNDFTRNSPQSFNQGAQARLSGQGRQEHQGYDQNASPFSRNALEELNGEPASYNFEYMVNDFEQGTDFGHYEERQDESAHGEYHVVLPDGRKQTVSYEADERGFKPRISYEDTDTFTRSAGGYDANANNLERSAGARSHGLNGARSHDVNGARSQDFNGARSHDNGYSGGRNGY